MKKLEFVKQLSNACEFEEDDFALETRLDSIEGYDSMAVMSIIAFVDEKFDTKLTAAQLQGITDFNSLIALIGPEKFDD